MDDSHNCVGFKLGLLVMKTNLRKPVTWEATGARHAGTLNQRGISIGSDHPGNHQQVFLAAGLLDGIAKSRATARGPLRARASQVQMRRSR